MLETILYADLGSAVTKLSAKGRTVCEESRVALDPGNSSCVLAVGDKCRGLLNAVPVYPVRGGAVANITLAAIMLRRMSLTLLKKRSLFGVELRLLLPGCCSQMQRLYAVDMARTAGFRRVRIMDSLLLSAAGGGLDVLSPQAVMTALRQKAHGRLIKSVGSLITPSEALILKELCKTILQWSMACS